MFKKHFTKDMAMMLFIIMLPFLFFLYNLAPKDTLIWDTKWFKIDSGMYEEVNYLLWLISIKLLTLFMLSVWFLTCKHWWRIILFLPISSEIHKLNGTIEGIKLGNDYTPIYLESIFYSIPYLIVLILLSKKMNFYKKHNTLWVNKDINTELIKLSKFNIKNYISVNNDLKEIERKKSMLTKREYLAELLLLRDRLTN